MKVLYNIVDKRVVASGLHGRLEGIQSALGTRGSWLGIRDSDEDLVNAPYKIKVVDNYDRDTVSDWLFAERSNLTEEEFEEFDRCVNSSESPDYYVQVEKDSELYDAYADLY